MTLHNKIIWITGASSGKEPPVELEKVSLSVYQSAIVNLYCLPDE